MKRVSIILALKEEIEMNSPVLIAPRRTRER